MRYAAWLLVLIAAGVSTWLTPPVAFDQTIEGFFPPDNPALESYQRSKGMFGGDQILFVVYDDPNLWTSAGMKRVEWLARRIGEAVPGVERIESLDRMPVPWQVDAAVEELASRNFSFGGLLRMIAGRGTVEMAVRHTEDDPQRTAELRRRLCANPLFNGLVVDESGQTTAVIVRLGDPTEIDQRASVTEARRVADAFAAEHEIDHIAVAGPPVLVVDGFISLDRDNRTLGLAAMLLMAVVMFAAVRNPVWAALPLVAGWATWELTRCFIAIFDLRLTLSSGPIVAQTVVLCMPAASHLAVRFREMSRRGLAWEEAGRSVMLSLFAPIAWCGLAAAAGYLATGLATNLRPMAQFGFVMFVSNLVAGFLAYCLAPGAMSFDLHSRNNGAPAAATVIERVGSTTGWVIERPVRTILFFSIPIAIAAIGASRIRFESNYINVYKSHSRTAQDYRFAEARLGGIGVAEVVLPAPKRLTPEWLEELDETTQLFASANPHVLTSAVSVADLLRPSSSPEPENGGAAAQVSAGNLLETRLRLLTGPHYVDLLDDFWNPDTGTTRIIVRLREDADADLKESCFANMRALARERHSSDAFVTGLSHLMTHITRAVIFSAFQSATWSSLLIVLLLSLAFRNPLLALVAFLPTLLAVGLVLGVMGWLGVKIDMSTALVASVAIGLSVDDAVHCLLNWKSHLAKGLTPLDALDAAYASSGPGVVLSSAAVSLGFLAMLLSEFTPMSNFGWLVAVATFGGSVGNLVVVPAILIVFWCGRWRRRSDNEPG